jgi:hypothetical protein
VITSLKIVAGSLVVVGIVVGFIERRYAHAFLSKGSPARPWWLPNGTGWLLTSVMAILYIVLDYLASHP